MQIVKDSSCSQSGFTLVEMMMAVIILGGGLLALASAFSQGMVLTSTSHYNQVAKDKASEAIESVFTSRDTRTIAWAQIRNKSDGGVFKDGPQLLRAQGADGLVNTDDDGAPENEVLPGPDNILGTADDKVYPMDKFTREIEITDVTAPNGSVVANLRQIRVTIRYQVGQLSRQYQLVTYISSFA
jgi:prepilin-type N-terminal cleavage/methylation domain-containing protein